MTLQEKIQFRLIGMQSSKYQGVKPDTKRKHEEADLHLQFCKWVKSDLPKEQPCLAQYPLQFVRHEREKARSKFMGNLMQVYNTDWDKLPDFELLHRVNTHEEVEGDNSFTYWAWDYYAGLYIEFKKPGRQWQSKGIIKPDCEGQYKCHQHLWSIGRCAYFCNDMEDAKSLLIDYLNGNPQPMQVYSIPVDNSFTLGEY